MLKLLTIPDPFLKKKVLYVVDIDENIRTLTTSMLDTMRNYPHCVGLAASQLGIDLRIIAVDVSLYPKKFENHGQLLLINPEITSSSGRQTFREGCLSIPDFTGNVTRADDITVTARDINNNKLEIKAGGFEATVLQHEIDHLDGILFLDRVSSLKTDVFRRKQVCPPR